jgi:hypothetical protein
MADVTRMGDWSPDTRECRWLDAGEGPRLGARFRGRNSNGRREWATTCVVTVCESGRRFAFEVRPYRLPVTAVWEYDIEPTAKGCLVRETVEDRRDRIAAWIGDRLSGTEDRAQRNEQTMRATLELLALAAESASP